MGNKPWFVHNLFDLFTLNTYGLDLNDIEFTTTNQNRLDKLLSYWIVERWKRHNEIQYLQHLKAAAFMKGKRRDKRALKSFARALKFKKKLNK